MVVSIRLSRRPKSVRALPRGDLGARRLLPTVLTLVLAASCTSTSTSSTTQPSTTAGSPVPGSTATTAVHRSDDVTWTVTEVPGYVAGIVETGEGLVAVMSSRPFRVSAFVSPDGVEWSFLGLIEDADSGVQKVVSSGEVLLAFGYRWLGDEGLPTWDRPLHPWVWASADGGVTWTGQEMEGLLDVTATPDGFVGVGRTEDRSQPGATIGVVWLSRDGLAWEEASFTDRRVGYSTEVRLVAWADDTLLALGYQSLTVNPSEIPGVNLAWASRDGRSLDPYVPEGFGGFPRKLIPSPFGLMVMATDVLEGPDGGESPEGGSRELIYRSEDGRVWARLPVGEGDWSARDLVAADSMVYILETQGQGQTDGARISYTSDGEAWNAMRLPLHGGGLHHSGSSLFVTSFVYDQGGERHLLASSQPGS